MERIKQLRRWVCWNATPVKGRMTKVPCAANGGATGTDEKYAHTWVTYEEAVEAMKRNGYTGVGFVIPEGMFFIDKDHIDPNDPVVQELLRRFPSYAERSYSGNGVHFFGMCDLSRIPVLNGKLDKRYYTKNPHNGLEVYIGSLTNRFAAFTDEPIQDLPLADCTDALLELLEKDMRREKEPQPVQQEIIDEAVDQDDPRIGEIIEALRWDRNAPKFVRLFDEGDITGYASQSEADAALCAIIAFRAGPNPALIDAIFRQSALYRDDKWERADYRASTIQCGIAARRGVYHHSTQVKPFFVMQNPKSGAESISSTRLAQFVREKLRYFFVQDHAMNSARCYVYRDGAYRLMSRTMMLGVIKKFITDYDEHLVKTHVLNEVYDLLLTDNIFVDDEELNSDENIINFQNGLLRLSDMTLLPHTPELLSTIQLPCDWPTFPGETPVYDCYMQTLTQGNSEHRQLLEEFGGVCLSNVKGWRMKKALFMYGPGDTGKSILKSLVEHMVGKGNFIGIDLAEIEARFGTGSIYGKRLVGSSDMSFMTVAELKTFKKCTGGDSIFAEFKGQNSFEYTFGGMMWFCMNRLPRFGGDDGQWVYERIMQIPCLNSIPAEQQDKHLLDKLLLEREGIVYRMVMALKNVIDNGYRFTEPESVRVDRALYRNRNSTVVTFFEDCMMPIPKGEKYRNCTAMKVYSAYQCWCRDNNRGYAKTAREFKDELAAHLGVTSKELMVRHREGMVYRDYTLNPEAAANYSRGVTYCSASPEEEFLN